MSKEEAVGKEEGVDTTIHSNDFTLQMTGLSNLKFDLTDHFITSGQPWEGISKIECNDSGCTMTVMAGRKGSEKTASWFADTTKPGSAIGCTTTDTMPEKLNFAFKGNMSFDNGGKTFIGENIVIAQGHTDGLRNNWWIGGPGMSILAAVPPFAMSESQTFKVNIGIPIAKVTFSATFADVSTVHMGVLSVQE